LSTPKLRMTLRSGKSLSSGNGSFKESAKVCCEKVALALTPRIWTFRAWNRL
jgi:hypothetical protein